MYKCTNCKKTFLIPGYLKISFTVDVPKNDYDPSKRKITTPCCPFCYSKEFEQIIVVC